MRCPEARHLVAACVLALASMPAMGSPEAVKAEVVERLQAALPGIPPSEYALGSAALDDELRAQLAQNAAVGETVVRAGREIWERRFKNGRSLAVCFPNGGRRVAAAYPQFDPRLKRVVTLEMAVNQCLKAHGEPLLEFEAQSMGVVTAYLRSLSNGQKIAVRVPAAAQDRFEEGRRMYFNRMGQRNFACASCHVRSAGRRYGDVPLSPAIGQATHWPVIRDAAPVTLHARIRECLELMGAAPFPAGSEELNHLEYFLTYLSGGLPLKANPWRPK